MRSKSIECWKDLSRFGRAVLVTCVAWILFDDVPAVQAQLHWDLINANLTGVAYGNGVYVFLEQNGWAWTSPDLAAWQKHCVGQEIELKSVAFGNGAFIAVGADCWIFRSTDGVDWSASQYPFVTFWGPPPLNNVAFVNGEFLVAGGWSTPDRNHGIILSSPDEVTWTKRFEDYLGLHGVAFGDGDYLAVGGTTESWQPYRTSKVVVRSEELVTWSSTELPQPGFMMDAAFGSGVFVAVTSSGEVWRLLDNRWERTLSSQAPLSITFGNGRFAVADWWGVIHWSADGLMWTDQPSSLAPNQTTRVQFVNDRFLLLADGGTVLGSTDAADWTVLRSNFTGGFGDIAYGKGLFVASNGGAMVTSSNGLAWTRHIVATNVWLKQIAFDGDKFVVIGTSLDPNAQGAYLFNSRDGTNWHRPELPTSVELSSISFAKDRFFVNPLSGPLLTSTNGEQWIPVGPWQSPWHVAYGNGRFVGSGGWSIDGVEWTNARRNVNPSDITFGRGVFVAVSGPIFASINGLDWRLQFSGPYDENYEAVDFVNGVFVAVGHSGLIATSLDGLVWTRRPATLNESGWYEDTLVGTAYGNGLYLSVDRRGHVQVSPSELLLQIRRNVADGCVELIASPGAAQAVDLEGSKDMAHWSTLLNLPSVTANSALRARITPNVLSHQIESALNHSWESGSIIQRMHRTRR